jgi:hypothetical protein
MITTMGISTNAKNSGLAGEGGLTPLSLAPLTPYVGG